MEQYIEFASRHTLLTASFFILSGLLIYSFFSGRLRGYENVTPARATELINRNDAIVLDVREDNEYKDGHIVNSVHVPASYLADRIKELEKYKNKPIIAGCRSGNRSAQACSLLKKQGFEQVFNLQGGIAAWQHENLPLTKK